jgi:PHP family Zn ribbon phosphoesterase
LIPLDEIIAEAKGVGKTSLGVERDYRGIVARFGSEFEILMRAKKEDLEKNMPAKIAEGVLRVREGKVNIKAGYDGEYGIASIFTENEMQKKNEQQLSLF